MIKNLLRVFTVLLVVGLSVAHWQLMPTMGELEKTERTTQRVSVEPLPLQVFCPGALVEVGGESGVELGKVERVGEALLSAFANPEYPQNPPVSTVEGFGLVVDAQEQSTNLISMIQTQVIERERASGLAATYCPKPTSSGWLIGGFSTVGSESVLVAANPAATEALVDIQIHTPSNVISDRFALAPGEQQLITTAQYANGEESFAIYFETSGPEISMALQNRKTRGLNPIGIEIEGPTLRPGTEFVFAGLRPLTQGFENPELRVFNPGDQATEVVLTIFAQDNVELFRQRVEPGRFALVPLEILGDYQLATLISDEPVLASIFNPSTEGVLDFAWLQPAELFTSMSLALSSYQNTVLVANPSASALTLSVESRTGSRLDVQSLVIAPFSQAAIPTRADSIRLDSQSEFAVALEILDPNGYSVIHPRESANLGNDLSIKVN